ncbi:MAG TPA: PAS domain S-box protein, partial [Burkholderiaceae bacterium]|nr:PAS domain S-box protein [Burkholderiaceae bacterium]
MTAVVAAMLIWHSEGQRLSEARTRVADMAGDHAQALQRGIERALSVTYAVAALVRQGNGTVRDYEAVATQMLPFYPGIAALGLSPGGIIGQVVPLQGNEKSIGFNQLQDIAQNKEALLARNTGKLTLAGPLQLVQGGLGVVGRLPVYLDDAQGKPNFWGFSYVTIRFPQALEAARLPLLADRGFSYELWRIVPDTGKKQTIAASGQGALDAPVERNLELPNGIWTLSVSPAKGWNDPLGLPLKTALGLLVCGLMAYMSKLLVELKAHEKGLEVVVQERTAEILATQRQLKATLDAIPDPLLELGLDGRYHGAHSPRADLPAVSADEAELSKNISDVFPPDAAAVVMAAVQEAHEKGWSNGRQFQLQRPHGQFWFELSVSRKPLSSGTEPRFMLLSRDITKRKRAEAQLELTAKVFEQSTEGIMIADAQRRIVQVNRAFTQISGYSLADVLGKTPRLSGPGRMADDFFSLVMTSLDTNGHWEGEARNRRKDGSSYPQWLSVTRVCDQRGTVTHFISIFRDITQNKEAEDRIRQLAHYDPLTGLPNRTLLADRSDHAISIAQRSGAPLTLIFLDLDH